MKRSDLADDAPALLGGRLVRRTPGVARFRRADYHGDRHVALQQAVRDTVEQQTGRRPQGPIRILTNLRCLSLCFNPVSFYYCFTSGADELDTVLAEVTNTPWCERQAYVIPAGHGRFEKAMNVSPFMAIRAVSTAPKT